MSFNAKNLAYEAKEPSFLRQLKSQYGGSDRHERPIARPRKAKDDQEDDDEPTYVDEGTNDTITKEDYKKMVEGDTEGDKVEATEAQSGALSESSKSEVPKRELIGSIGGGSKKRTIKAVGGDGDESQDKGDTATTTTSTKKAMKKKKKLKLSFDDET